MKTVYSSLLGISLAFLFYSCSETKNLSDSDESEVLLKVEDEEVTAKEFLYVYQKNNSRDTNAFSEESIKDYLDLYINFKLKVKEAKERGMDTLPSFKSELSGYRKQLVQPYLTEKEVTDKLVKEAYERLKTEVSASHILIRVPADAPPSDTLKAYRKITAIKEEIEKGADFNTKAKQVSEDPSAAQNGGDLGYFTAFQMVYPFEDAAYNTKEGEISDPVRTRFGYHLVKVKDKRPSRGKVKVAHIMIRTNQGAAEEDSIAAKRKIEEIYNKLQEGEEWALLVRQFSEDPSSNEKGGELPYIGTNNTVPSFENAAFALASPGDISQPVLTPYGWHIIKLIEKKELEPFEELEAELEKKVERDSRSEKNKKALLKRLERENELSENEKGKLTAASLVDSTIYTGLEYDSTNKDLKNEIFTIMNKEYTVGQFLNYVSKKPRPKMDIPVGHYMYLLYEDFKNEKLLEYEENHLEDKYYDFKMLMNEYRDGILLFDLMDKVVWSKAIEDTSGLKSYYATNKENYRWDKRAKVEIYDAASPELLTKALEKSKERRYPVEQPKLMPLNFEENRSLVPESDTFKIKTYARIINSREGYSLGVVGHAKKGEKSRIAQKRAENVVKMLKEFGLKDSLITIETELKSDAPKVTFQPYSSQLKALEKMLNESSALNIKIIEGLYEKEESPYLEELPFKVANYDISKNDRNIIVRILEIQEPRIKKFEEARGLIISDYQDYLEKEWVKSLREKYDYSINDEVLNDIIEKR